MTDSQREQSDGEKSFNERVEEIRQQRPVTPDEEDLLDSAQSPPDLGVRPSFGTGNSVLSYATTNTTKIKEMKPATVLVCTDCLVYFEFDGEWEHCPRCADGLKEVDRA